MAAEGRRLRRHQVALQAVNGAAAGWPRKGFFRGMRMSEASNRQWGRGRMAAEGPKLSLGFGAALLRQWGRGRMAAEGDIQCR